MQKLFTDILKYVYFDIKSAYFIHLWNSMWFNVMNIEFQIKAYGFEKWMILWLSCYFTCMEMN